MSTLATRDTKHTARLDWLRRYPVVSELPGVHDTLTGRQAEALDRALRAMTLVKLFAPSGLPAATRWRIRLLVSELRGEAVSDAARRWALKGKL